MMEEKKDGSTMMVQQRWFSDFTIRFFVIGTDENLSLSTEIEKATHVWQASGIMLRKAMSKASGIEIK